MPKRYEVNFAVRASNAIVAGLLKLGVNIGSNVLLTVAGRKTGEPRTVPVTVLEADGRRWLIASFGQVNWVRNVRAAGEGTLTRGRRSEKARFVELSAPEAVPVIKRGLAIAPGIVKAYFDVTLASSDEEFLLEAPRHPVFEILPAARPLVQVEAA